MKKKIGFSLAALVLIASLMAFAPSILQVWQGGTGFGSVTQGDLIYGSATSTTTLSKLAKSTASNVFLSNQGTSNNPSWVQPAFSNLSGSATCAQLPALTGDATTSAGSCATTVAKVNGVAYPSGPSTHTVPIITASNTATYKALPSCADTAGAHLNFDTATDAFSCGTSSSASGTVTTTGSPASGNLTKFSGATSITNGDLSGDVTTSGTLTTTLGSNFKIRSIPFTLYNSGGLTSGTGLDSTDYVTVPYSCTIAAYNIVVDAGTITVKFWKKATGTAIPTSSDSISTSGVSISSGTAIHSTTTSDFTSTTVSANDIMAMNITTVSTAKYVNAVLQCNQ